MKNLSLPFSKERKIAILIALNSKLSLIHRNVYFYILNQVIVCFFFSLNSSKLPLESLEGLCKCNITVSIEDFSCVDIDLFNHKRRLDREKGRLQEAIEELHNFQELSQAPDDFFKRLAQRT